MSLSGRVLAFTGLLLLDLCSARRLPQGHLQKHILQQKTLTTQAAVAAKSRSELLQLRSKARQAPSTIVEETAPENQIPAKQFPAESNVAGSQAGFHLSLGRLPLLFGLLGLVGGGVWGLLAFVVRRRDRIEGERGRLQPVLSEGTLESHMDSDDVIIIAREVRDTEESPGKNGTTFTEGGGDPASAASTQDEADYSAEVSSSASATASSLSSRSASKASDTTAAAGVIWMGGQPGELVQTPSVVLGETTTVSSAKIPKKEILEAGSESRSGNGGTTGKKKKKQFSKN